jgi:hypothetical protein
MAGLPSPPPITEPQDSFAWQQWYMSLVNVYSSVGAIPWTVIDFTGSAITDILTRDHNTLQSIQGGTAGEYYHLTSAQHTALTGLSVFKTISVSGQSDVVADSMTDTLTLVAGTNMTITTNATTDEITINMPSVDENDISLTDIATNNSSTSKHGFLKKLDNDSAHFMDGQGNWSTPVTTGAVASVALGLIVCIENGIGII